jgi:hypothetical protein
MTRKELPISWIAGRKAVSDRRDYAVQSARGTLEPIACVTLALAAVGRALAGGQKHDKRPFGGFGGVGNPSGRARPRAR